MNLVKSIGRQYLDRKIINLYKTRHSKNLLISYITRPLRTKKLDLSHTNNREIKSITESFKNHSFNIDVVNYQSQENLDYSKYNLIFGFGDPICKAFYDRNFKGKSIYYGTGMHICSQNTNSTKRIKDFSEKYGVSLPESGRIVQNAWSEQTSLVDAIFLIGNDLCQESYLNHANIPIYKQPVSFFPSLSSEESLSRIKQSKGKDFLWFNSSGLIHKGLDLLLEYFSDHTEYNLHICGPISREKSFEIFFRDSLYHRKNIFCHGFVEIGSPKYLEIISKCRFIISPSCSEGEPSAIVNNIANGLIPITTMEGGYQSNWNGVIIKSINLKGVSSSISQALALDEETLTQYAQKNISYIYKNNSIQNFSSVFNNNVNAFIKDFDL